MKLPRQSVKEFIEAILVSYDHDSLRMMLRLHLGESLSHISSKRNLPETALELIEWAEKTGRVSELFQAAYEYNPTNPKLAELAEIYSDPPYAGSAPGKVNTLGTHQEESRSGENHRLSGRVRSPSIKLLVAIPVILIISVGLVYSRKTYFGSPKCRLLEDEEVGKEYRSTNNELAKLNNQSGTSYVGGFPTFLIGRNYEEYIAIDANGGKFEDIPVAMFEHTPRDEIAEMHRRANDYTKTLDNFRGSFPTFHESQNKYGVVLIYSSLIDFEDVESSVLGVSSTDTSSKIICAANYYALNHSSGEYRGGIPTFHRNGSKIGILLIR